MDAKRDAFWPQTSKLGSRNTPLTRVSGAFDRWPPRGARVVHCAIMEPRIQSAKTTDEVNIADAVLGSGPPLLWVTSTWASHLTENLWAVEAARHLAEHLLVIRYDGRRFRAV